MNAPGPLRLALDQNFPTPLINAVRGYLPADIDVRSLREIDPRLSDLDDRPLFIALHQLGWHGLITNNYKMLDVPAEIAAIVKTKAVVIAITTNIDRTRGSPKRFRPGHRRIGSPYCRPGYQRLIVAAVPYVAYSVATDWMA